MKRILSLLLAAALLSALLAGCIARQVTELPEAVPPGKPADAPAPEQDAPTEEAPAEQPEEPAAGAAGTPEDAPEAEIAPAAPMNWEVTLYLPDDMAMGFVERTESIAADDELPPQSVVNALIAHGALPEGVTVNDFSLETDGRESVEGEGLEAIVSYTVEEVRIHLDLSAEFRDALASTGTAGETMLLGSLVNTMLEAYNAGSLLLTCEGAPIETGHNVYDFPLYFFDLDGGAE